MIALSNGHKLTFVTSGILGFDCHGHLWQKPWILLGITRLELFTHITPSITLRPRRDKHGHNEPGTGLISYKDGLIRREHLDNPGMTTWYCSIGQHLRQPSAVIPSLAGDQQELVEMTMMMNGLDGIVGVELNFAHASDLGFATAEAVIQCVRAVKNKSRHPIIVRLATGSDHLAITAGLGGVVEAVYFDGVTCETAFPDSKLPERFGPRFGSKLNLVIHGKPAQKPIWEAIKFVGSQGAIPVLGSEILDHYDPMWACSNVARAIVFGRTYLLDRTCWYKPWQFLAKASAPTTIAEEQIRIGLPIGIMPSAN